MSGVSASKSRYNERDHGAGKESGAAVRHEGQACKGYAIHSNLFNCAKRLTKRSLRTDYDPENEAPEEDSQEESESDDAADDHAEIEHYEAVGLVFSILWGW